MPPNFSMHNSTGVCIHRCCVSLLHTISCIIINSHVLTLHDNIGIRPRFETPPLHIRNPSMTCWHIITHSLCPNLVSISFYAIPILHFKFPKFFIYLYYKNTWVFQQITFLFHCVGFLRQLIGNMKNAEIHPFLRFVTGSSVLIDKSIKVTFNNLHGAARRPIIHTCSCMLELPMSYCTYLDFEQEFLAVLSSDEAWVMDCI